MATQAAPLLARLSLAMARDATRLARRIERARVQRAPESEWSRLAADVERSVAKCSARAAAKPAISYPPDLPVARRAEEIARAIREHQVVIVCGETGSGKTTQLPKICLAAGRGEKGLIGHTQPRRIAARAVATRIAHELGQPVGEAVGYKVRFTDHTRPDAYIKLMTDGILLAETQADRFLDAYDTLILDEAHERSLNIDFLLGVVGLVTLVLLDGAIANLHRKAAARDVDDRRLAEVTGETLRVDGRGSDDELQIAPARQQPREIAEQEIDVQAALVRFVEDQRVVRIEEAIRLRLGEQDAVGHQLD